MTDLLQDKVLYRNHLWNLAKAQRKGTMVEGSTRDPEADGWCHSPSGLQKIPFDDKC